MEKEKILQQLEEKLLPSVEKVNSGQATEHDFFPALLWMILEQDKDIESSLQDLGNKSRNNFQKTINHIASKNQDLQKETNSLLEEKTLSLSKKIDDLLLSTSKNQDLQKETDSLLEEKILLLSQKTDELSKVNQNSDSKAIKYFRWIFGFCIFQFITLTSLIVFLLMR